MEKNGHLVDFEHHVGKEELVAVFWLDSLMITMLVVLILRFASSLMQIYPITER